MLKSTAWSTLILALVLGVSAASAATFADDFEDGFNVAGWTFGGSETIEPSGGNPGGWLYSQPIETFGPRMGSSVGGTPFTGDYRAMGVTSIGVDARLIHNDWGTDEENPFTLLLRDTNGTPQDPSDDDWVYYVYPQGPLFSEGWVHFTFDIPSGSTDPLPPGWTGGSPADPENFRPGIDWNDVIQSVDEVEFWWWHPAWFGIYQYWQVGADNISIHYGAPVPIAETSWGRLKNLYR